MANSPGNQSRILIGGHHASAHTRSMAPSLMSAMIDNTSVLDEAYSFIPGHNSSSLTVETMFDDVTTADLWTDYIQDLFAVSAGAVVSVAPTGFTVGQVAWLGSSILSTLAIAGNHDGLVMRPLTFTAKDPAAWGHALTGLQTITTTTTGTAVDNAAATTDGALINVHCTAISGSPSVVVTIQDSADNSSWATIATATAFTTAIGAQRLTVAGTVRRYTRAVCTFTGGSTPSITVQASLARL